jgi:Ras-related protein Rab-8A
MHGIMMFYDITNERSFEEVKDWNKAIDLNALDPVNLKRVLVGCKRDLASTSEKVIETSRGQTLADEFGVKFFETSSKDDVNATEAFMEIIRQVVTAGGGAVHTKVQLENKSLEKNTC